MILATRVFILSAISLTLLSACGGSGGGPDPAAQPPRPPPADTTLDWDDDNWDEKEWT